MTPEQFRQHGHQLIDLIADYRQTIAERPVMAQVEPGYLKAALPVAAPHQGEPFEAILDDFNKLVMPGLSHWQHPDFYGYFPSNGTLSSVLGDFLSTGLGVLGLSWQSSPALSELEETTLDWLRQLLGLSTQWSGVIQDTASTSTLVALICARERASDFALTRGGLQGQPKPLIVYASAHAHSSVDKAALLAGFGRENIRLIATDEQFAMQPAALQAAIEADLAAGNQPCAVVATTGTTTTTALDPLAAIGAISQAHQLWLHVDSAMAGSAMILPECRWMWDGIELADSVVVNAHKWLGVAFDCSIYYVRDPQHLIRVMSTNPSYLQSAVDGEVKNLRDWGIPLGRRFRALKLWLMLRSEGVEALQQRLRRDLDNARWLAAQVEAAEDWQVLAPVQLQTLCIRHCPDGLEGAALDAHTRAWADRLNGSGLAYVTPATLEGQWMVRVSVGALPTEREHVERLWANLQAVVSA
ncbi:DOPA decarboxylase [Pseudomonas shirazensis]|uniref:Amino acid decarboxylase n=1 Tax=Pseudomonas putida TaxID=303 RepID=A0A2S3WFJ7_PSEPU|nr:DOPA decarboxylase [Pseudomonas putida]POF89726.1 amino acid decarboxylase [Pseudomonas putida]RZI91504.1 MAG: aspartate aminotransferase family protein [Pseudomonas sp.]